MTNAQIAEVFTRLGDLLEISGANPFRVRAYRNGARALESHAESLADHYSRHQSLPTIAGIGDDLSQKIGQLIRGEELPLLRELESQIPDGVLAMLRVPGLGPSKAAKLHKELGIQSLDQLRAACEAGQVQHLKGFGAKTEQMILKGLSIAETAARRLLWADADQLAQELRRQLSAAPGVERLELAGSYRRGKDTVGDLDVLVVAADPVAVMDQFARFPAVKTVIGRGDTKMSVRTGESFQIDLRVVPAKSFGAALQYFTGSKEHNVTLRGRAKQQGLKINEYGVFRLADDGGASGSEEYVAGAAEEDVYQALGLPWIPPELREGRQEFPWADAGKLPQLIELADIQGDLHMHTTATDGTASLEEMVEAARRRGLRYIAITDHSQRVSMARGLNAHRLLAQWEEIDALNKRLHQEGVRDFVVLKGIECDILEAGGMDLPDEVLSQADWVLASVHYGQRQSRAQITDRILGAIGNPCVKAVAHPTGRLLNQRDPYEVDMEAVIQAAVEHGKFLELNANPMRLDLNELHCAQAKAAGVPIVINTDAHSVEGFDVMRYGILQARRGGLTRADVANTLPWPEFSRRIHSRAP
jgi:DNA polymerase (family 10)